MDAEKKLLEAYAAIADTMVGEAPAQHFSVPEPWSIQLWARAFDTKNPLYQDEAYAAASCWGGLIAPPLYQECMTLTSWNCPIPPELGHPSHGVCGLPFMLGEEWEFFQPVRPGVRYHLFRRRPQLTKDVEQGDDGILRYTNMTHDIDFVDEAGEKVSTCRCFLRLWLSQKPVPRKEPCAYRYSPEELSHITALYNGEVLRGAVPRRVGEVHAGEQLPPAVLGPTTIWDMVVMTVGRQDQELLPMMALKNQPNAPSVPDPVTGVPKCFMECHLANDTAWGQGLPAAIHAGAVDRSLLVRIVTNWMGDQGFITRFCWQPLLDTYVGDTLFAEATVTAVDTAAGLCQIEAQLRNQNGQKTAAAQITVRLPL